MLWGDREIVLFGGCLGGWLMKGGCVLGLVVFLM